MARVLIAGCGDVGIALGTCLGEAGHEVHGLRRSAEPFSGPIHALGADLADKETLSALPHAIDFVFYLVSADAASEEAYRQAYVQNLDNLLSVLEARKEEPKRIFFASSTSVYAQADDEWVDEDSVTNPTRFTGKRMLEAEALLRCAAFASTVVRFSGIYGPKKTGLIDLVRAGRFSLVSDSPYTNRIHVADCAGVLAHLMHLENVEDLYLASDCEPVRLCEVEAWIADQLSISNRDPAKSGEASRLRLSKRCRADRIRSTGYVFQYPSFREGYAAVLGGTEGRCE